MKTDRLPEITRRVNERWFSNEFQHNGGCTRITQEAVKLVIEEWVKEIFLQHEELSK